MGNWGYQIKRIREQKHLTQKELSDAVGLSRSNISRIEAGAFKSAKQDILVKLARAFDMNVGDLTAELYGNKEEKPYRSMSSVLEEAKMRLEALEVVEIPIRGHVPAGYPQVIEEHADDYVVIPKELLGKKNTDKLYALRISGESLIGDDIQNGDLVIIDPDAHLVDGRIYIVRIDNEVVARHVTRLNGKVRLRSTNGDFKDMDLDGVEILGQVILSGLWKQH